MAGEVFIHPSADVSPNAKFGAGTKIWHQAQVREGAVVGKNCIIGKGAYVDFNVHIGDNCKLQNGAYIYHGVNLGDGVFVGPGAMCLNDKYPRAINLDGSIKTDADWVVSDSIIGDGAGIGGGAIILPGVNVGKWAIIGSGAVVTRDVPDHGLAYGNPARVYGLVCKCGQRFVDAGSRGELHRFICETCAEEYTILESLYHIIYADKD